MRGGHDQPESDRRPGDTSSASGVTATLDIVELGAPFLELLADQGERLEDRIRRTGHGHYSLRARAVADVDLGAGLRQKTSTKL